MALLKGVSLNGQIVDTDDHDPDKKTHTDETFGAELKAQKKIIPHVKIRDRYAEETKRVAKRGFHLSARQIRKEYGIMAKPYKKIGENVLWLIINKGPISTAEIANELGKKQTQFSGVLSEMVTALGPDGTGDLGKKKRSEGLGYDYSAVSPNDVSADSLYQKYLGVKRNWRKAKAPKAAPASVTEASVPSKKTGAAIEQVQQAIDQINQIKQDISGLNVDVNVKIEVLFGFKKQT